MAPRERPNAYHPDQAGELLRRLEPQIEGLFRKYHTSRIDAEQMVAETLVVLGVRREYIRDPDAWFLDAIEARCQRLVEKRLEEADGPEN